jgi:lipopolysaccharide transport system permease protein
MRIYKTIWEYRELVKNLTIAELKNRYQNTSLGFFWSILSPLLFASVLYFVFRKLFSQEENFAINLIVGIMFWRFFSVGTSTSLTAIISHPNLVTKLYIPRQILVLSSCLSNLIASLLEFIILIPIIFVLLKHIPLTIWLYPVIHVIVFFAIYGIGLLLASLYVYFRDLLQIWEFLINVLFYTSPIIYPMSIVPPYLKTFYLLNPITRMVFMYRDVMIVGYLPSRYDLVVVIIFALIVFLAGNYVFSKLQRRFAEEI